MQLRPLVFLASVAVGSSFLFQAPRTEPTRFGARAPLTRLNVLVQENAREGVPMPEPTKNAKPSKLFVFLWIDHLGNRIYKATDIIGTTPRRIKLWNPLKSDEEQNYPEAGMQSVPTFTKFMQLSDDSLDSWVEGSFGELDDVADSPVAYTTGEEVSVSTGAAAAAAAATEASEVDWSEEIEARYKLYNEYYPPATFEAMIKAMESSWRTIILSRGKQGAKAMREFYRDMHQKHPEVEEKVWIMETHATTSPVPGDVDTYNHWMSDDDILKMAHVATEGHDNVVEFSGLEFDDVVDGIKGEDWVTIPPPMSWFADEKAK